MIKKPSKKLMIAAVVGVMIASVVIASILSNTATNTRTSDMAWFDTAWRQHNGSVTLIEAQAALVSTSSNTASRIALMVDLAAMQKVCQAAVEEYNERASAVAIGAFNGQAPAAIDASTCQN